MEEFLRKLKELLKDVEGVDMMSIETELKGLVDDKTDKQNLLSKNKGLLDEKKALETKVADLELQIQGFDTEELARLKGLEEEYLKGKDVDLDGIKSKIELKWKNQLNQKEQELENTKTLLGNTNKQLEDMLIDQELEENFNKGRKILDSHKDMLKVYFRSKVRVERDDDEITVYIKDGANELPVEDFFEYWKGTDGAKQYLEANYTSGGGVTGNKGSFKNTKKPWKEMTVKERVELFQENPAEYARLKAEASKR